MTTADAKLSQLQRSLLLSLYGPCVDFTPEQAASDPAFLHFGCRLKLNTAGRSDSAAVSRAMRRLEDRGLLLRQNQSTGNPATGQCRHTAAEPHNRTTHVRLTLAGLDAAKRLT